jgi:uncharacterized membrane protein
MTGELEASPGVRSSMRVLVRSGRRAGWAMILSAVALSGAMLALGRGYELVPVAVLLVSTGAGMMTGLGFAKAAQARTEGPNP